MEFKYRYFKSDGRRKFSEIDDKTTFECFRYPYGNKPQDCKSLQFAVNDTTIQFIEGAFIDVHSLVLE